MVSNCLIKKRFHGNGNKSFEGVFGHDEDINRSVHARVVSRRHNEQARQTILIYNANILKIPFSKIQLDPIIEADLRQRMTNTDNQKTLNQFVPIESFKLALSKRFASS